METRTAREAATAEHEVRTTARVRPRLQRRLSVGSADDPLEVEADRVADQVLRVLRSSTAAPAAMRGGDRSTRIARHAGHDHDHGAHDHGSDGPEVGWDGGGISAELTSQITSTLR